MEEGVEPVTFGRVWPRPAGTKSATINNRPSPRDKPLRLFGASTSKPQQHP
ncbi:hypothetical protein ACWV95_20540 [Streptomyces albus]